MFDVKHDLEKFQTELQARATISAASQKRAMSAAVQSLFVASKNMLTRLVYQKDIPTHSEVYDAKLKREGKARQRRFNGKGKPAWKRKMRAGGILGNETFSVSTDGTQGAIFTDPDSDPAKPITNYPGGYAQKRHTTDGLVTKAAPWREHAFKQGSQRAVDKFRESIARDMNQ